VGSEWAHAFGLSDLARPAPFAQSDAVHWWQAAGVPGEPDSTENVNVPAFAFTGAAFQMAGPQPTPARIAQGLENLPIVGGWSADGHDPTLIEVGFRAPDAWTAARDVREVYWSSNRTSEVDGKSGSYCPVAGGQRYEPGQIPSGPAQPFNPARNGC
jgi:hypothetical protein